MKEIWKPIPGYEGLYEVSSLGRVKSLRKNIIMKQVIINRGYCSISLTKDGEHKRFLVHRLVAMAFCEKPEGKDIVNHIDGSKRKNWASNLEWVDQRENVHKGKMVLRPVIRSDGKTEKYYETICATQEDGFSKGSVCMCCKGELETYRGYSWRYAGESGQAATA